MKALESDMHKQVPEYIHDSFHRSLEPEKAHDRLCAERRQQLDWTRRETVADDLIADLPQTNNALKRRHLQRMVGSGSPLNTPCMDGCGGQTSVWLCAPSDESPWRYAVSGEKALDRESKNLKERQ